MIKSANFNLEYNAINNSLVTKTVKISPIQETKSWLEHQDTIVARKASLAIFKLTFFYLSAQVARLLMA